MFLAAVIPILLVAGLIFAIDDDDDDDHEETAEPDEPTRTVTGTGGPDFIDESGAEDDLLIQALAGSDLVYAGAGDDTIIGGGGNDAVESGAGDDRVFLDAGIDLWADAGGDDPAEIVLDLEGDDFVRGGGDEDFLYGAGGSDTLLGDTGADLLIAVDLGIANGTEDQPDLLRGGFGADVLVGDDGDTLAGGEGEDVFVVVVPDEETPEPAILEDVRPGEPVFIVVDEDSGLTQADLSLERGEDIADTTVLLAGKPVAHLTGVDRVTDLPAIDVVVDPAGQAIRDIVLEELAVSAAGRLAV